MLYLLDTNVLIDANRDYYPIHRVPEFWDWLVYLGNKGLVKIPIEIFEEISEGTDALAKWVRKEDVKSALLFQENVDEGLTSKVVNEGYANDLTDVELEKLGRDPFIIAYALKNNKDRCVVTTENSKPSRMRANRHIPDICTIFGIQSCTTYEFIEVLDFSTNWKTTI